MNLSSPFISRPVLTTLSMLTIILFGLFAYTKLPVSDLPNVDFPTISVSASLAGASPDRMASSVATPLEKEFSTIAGVDTMTSSSSQGNTQITLQFNLDRDIDAAAQDVQAAIARASRRLPSDMRSPPSYQKVNPADSPILFLALTSPTLPMSTLDEYGQTLIGQRISMVSGVAAVQVFGSQKYAVRIQIDRDQLASMGISFEDVVQAVQQQNSSLPLGSIDGVHQSFVLESNGQLSQADEYRRIVVAHRNGQPVRLEEVASVTDSVENNRLAAWFVRDGKQQRAIMLAIQKQPGVNTVEVADAVKALLPIFRDQLPASVDLQLMSDRSLTIRESAHDVQFTLYLTLGLVVMVIFLFLRSLSATVIPSLALPLSVIGTFIVMHLLGYSLNNLTLMAMTLAVGFVVDDAIVMLENIVRHMEMGKDRKLAAYDGSREIGFTIVSMTVSLAAVFIPVLFMGGLVGRLFREFAVTIGAAVLISGFVSLTLTPMLCSLFLRHRRDVRHNLAYRISEAGFDWMVRFYGWSLHGVLRQRFITLLFALGMLGGTIYLFMKMPMGFIPSEDRDTLNVSTEGAQDISFESMTEHQLALADIVMKDPNVDRFMCSAGGRGGAANAGRMFVMLKPRNQRQQSADQVAQGLRGKLSGVPGIRAVVTNPPPINVGGRQSRSLYQVTLQATDTEELFAYGAELQDQMGRIEEIQDVNSDMQLNNPQVRLEIDRELAKSLNVTPQQVENAVFTAFGSREVTTILGANNHYSVVMELLPQYQRDIGDLPGLPIRSSTGQIVQLDAVAQIEHSRGPLSINHSGQLPSVTISFNLKPGVSLSQAITKIEDVMRTSAPDGISSRFQGTAQAFQDSLAGMGMLLILAVVVIYVVLGILYESFLHPITILSALPFAGFGALLTLMVFNVELSLYAFVGIIMLVGLVKKNGIMMIDFALEAQRKEGKNPRDAIHEACIIRFRPIMMTTMAALMAAVPIAVGYGAGGEARQPLGLAVVGGLLFSQTLTLYVTPVFFLYMDSLHKLLRGRRRAAVGA